MEGPVPNPTIPKPFFLGTESKNSADFSKASPEINTRES
jgi:hypothetical protein